MKSITTVSGLQLVLLTTVASAEDSRKWYAVAHKYNKGRFGDYSSYGVAWNFSTHAAAISAAIAECEKRSGIKCKEYDVDHDYCFVIQRRDWRDGKAPTAFYFHTKPFRKTGCLFQTEEEAHRVAPEEVRDRNRRLGQWQKRSLELVVCSGDPRNRKARR